MAITSNNSISMSALRTEFKGGSAPVSMSQLNRGGGYVPLSGARNSAIPTSDSNLSFSKYRNTSKTVVVTYEIIGAGGTGGFGVGDGGEEYRGTFGAAGGSSAISDGSITLVTANGGAGGENCGLPRGRAGQNGYSSHYGAGGLGGALNQNGKSPKRGYFSFDVQFGAGGGGGGGDGGSFYDSGGCGGAGGSAGTRKTGSFPTNYDNVLTMTIGVRGSTNTPGHDGARGESGYVALRWDSKGIIFYEAVNTRNATIN